MYHLLCGMMLIGSSSGWKSGSLNNYFVDKFRLITFLKRDCLDWESCITGDILYSELPTYPNIMLWSILVSLDQERHCLFWDLYHNLWCMIVAPPSRFGISHIGMFFPIHILIILSFRQREWWFIRESFMFLMGRRVSKAWIPGWYILKGIRAYLR